MVTSANFLRGNNKLILIPPNFSTEYQNISSPFKFIAVDYIIYKQGVHDNKKSILIRIMYFLLNFNALFFNFWLDLYILFFKKI